MPEIALKIPTSATPLAGSGPISEARAITGEMGAEDAASFANLLKGNLQAAQGKELPPELLADLMADAMKPDEDVQTLITSEDLPAGAEAIAAALMLAPALQQAEAMKGIQQPAADAEDALASATEGGGKSKGDDLATLSRQAAGIAAEVGSAADAAGKPVPELERANELLKDSFADSTAGTLQQAQHADFRAHMAAAQAPKAELAVATPITHPGWAEDVGHQITWLAEQGTSKAELVLTPPHLGRIEIKLEIGTDLSTAQFVSASPQVREALEQAMPRLREMLAQGGISLGEANVSSDQPSRDGGGSDSRSQRGRDGGGDIAVAPAARRGVGLVDLFA
ncbi:flagellar hook-length control protein FliK [Methyloversatilis universalis]|uniref:flagellar hook-length control protein FliK n=1 Tax=Methyloversatilis universalis TaxID=378211 RepID=UPI000376E1FC|nr:flagellar hook-length control protein FliK [Methyloversatilis universalis]